MKKLAYLLSTLFFLVSVNANEYIHFYGNESDITEEIVTIF